MRRVLCKIIQKVFFFEKKVFWNFKNLFFKLSESVIESKVDSSVNGLEKTFNLELAEKSFKEKKRVSLETKSSSKLPIYISSKTDVFNNYSLVLAFSRENQIIINR